MGGFSVATEDRVGDEDVFPERIFVQPAGRHLSALKKSDGEGHLTADGGEEAIEQGTAGEGDDRRVELHVRCRVSR